MLRFGMVAVGVGWLLTASGWAQTLPPGYQGVVEITNDNAFNRRPSINNRGQIVFAKWIDPYNERSSEIYLYDNGVLTRLTNDDLRDEMPDINDASQIVWSRAIGAAGTFEIVVWSQGQLAQLTYDDLNDEAPSINNQGWIAWDKWTTQGCDEADIYLYNGQTIQQITFGGYSNQTPCLNVLGDLVWTRYDFCPWPWLSEIMLRSEGVTQALTGNQGEAQLPGINKQRLVAWYSAEPPTWNHHIMLWQNGFAWQLTEWGSGLRMNNRGDVVFNRWHEDTHTWQVWLYLHGQFWQITNDPFWNYDGDINDQGDVVWQSGNPFDVDIKLLRRFPAGDLNCDGVVNGADIDPFVLALTDPAGYAQAYPNCDATLADINADGLENSFDIDPFVALLAP